MILNNAKNIYVDGNPALRVYADGELVWGLPPGYTRCRYLETNGKQYVNTGIIPSNETGAMFTVALEDVETDRFIWGCRERTTTDSRFTFGIAKGHPYVGFGVSHTISTAITILPLQKYTIYMNYLNDRAARADFTDERVGLPELTIRFTRNIMIGGRISSDGLKLYAQKIYGCAISSGRTNARYFIPALDASGKPCMYDTVTKQPFYNEGAGQFGYETISGTYAVPI